ncbi:hypothetical protein ASG52_25400 [Methylobacterium sp. Leaf456]|uniref:hypothetical protein n=1 Tax=Methylobacterium sp. Leaf456 TaxID=1736382 RepID=UPI0006F3D13C|nr:hypothetical protein [Methylobacterium sp. Leaf456]KQT53192.1 hypothetical protein ASG52_25400 [Methylobacterium sp. Leaf456]
MDVPAIYDTSPAEEVLRDRSGVIVGRIERHGLTGLVIARNAQGVIVGRYSAREGLTRDAFGRIIARGDVLSGLLFRP